MSGFHFPVPSANAELDALRARIADFLSAERAAGSYVPQPECWMASADPAFSRKMGAGGFIGMTWSPEYGGQGLSALHRYVVTEECLRAGAPVAAHWIADRQSAPLVLELGTEAQKADILPRIARGECYFAIGLSEPGAGSDLANVRTLAEQTSDGWLLNGSKIWSSGAHISHYMIALVRTSPPDGRNRHIGLSQVLIDLHAPGVTVRGITDLAGDQHFNEVFFDNVVLPADALLGPEGNGWAQATGELAMERSGPERLLSTFATFEMGLRALQGQVSAGNHARLGSIFARLRTLRAMSFSIAHLLHDGIKPETEAALMKDLGNRFESDLNQQLRVLLNDLPANEWSDALKQMLSSAILRAPPNSLRGGTTEVMRGIIARQLGMR
jgi:alkylation response protein AidB-like acyl-CoA dehydrogenase